MTESFEMGTAPGFSEADLMREIMVGLDYAGDHEALNSGKLTEAWKVTVTVEKVQE